MASKALINLLLCGRSDLFFHYENRCSYTVWLAASPSVGDADPERNPETLEIFSMPVDWTGIVSGLGPTAPTMPHFISRVKLGTVALAP
ncbi:hypothetical protein CJ030_MR2G025724 [Morella rubra]|uniref:Uncharacterized protein n=1 Tax=Morella rubra TaxID=262757 RepID=A0A6A1WEC7_9ROSI|nr:hypothetical protein CJ030_MR2G025724 [Morella rubra]